MLSTLGRSVRPRFCRGVSQALADPAAWNQAPTVVSVLPNGVKVATQTTHNEMGSVGLFVNAGSRSETAVTAGAAALIEPLALMGTKKRAQAALANEVESMGGQLSVQVGREQTSFAMSVGKENIKQGIDIVCDLGTGIAVENFDKNKSAILRALEESDKPTRDVIDDRLHLCAFRDCSLGFSNVGPFDGADALSSSQLRNYLDSSFVSNNMVLASVGPASHAEVVAAATAALGNVKSGSQATQEQKPYFCGAELQYRNDEMGPLAYISVGWEAVPWRSPDAVTFMLFTTLIGSYRAGSGLVPGNLSGNRTVNAVANKMGVGCANEFDTFVKFYKDTGIFGWYAVCDEVAVEHCVGEMMFGINLLSFAVTDEEVERAKRELKIKLFAGSGSASDACATLGEQMLAYGRSIPAAEMALRIDAIDAEEVKRVAYAYLNDAEIATTALGPLHGFPQYLDLRRMTNMHRY
jgi:processing peptidase subunit beta